MSVTMKVPALFWHDHKGRGFGATALMVKDGKGLVEVNLDEPAWNDLYSDASFYAASDSHWFTGDYRGIVASAKTTIRRMDALVEIAS
jgi:hypothetical protein